MMTTESEDDVSLGRQHGDVSAGASHSSLAKAEEDASYVFDGESGGVLLLLFIRFLLLCGVIL